MVNFCTILALGQPAKKPLAIMVIPKNILPAIPANGEVTDRSLKLNPDMAWHVRKHVASRSHMQALSVITWFDPGGLGLTPVDGGLPGGLPVDCSQQGPLQGDNCICD